MVKILLFTYKKRRKNFKNCEMRKKKKSVAYGFKIARFLYGRKMAVEKKEKKKSGILFEKKKKKKKKR
jgi:hypothetical protein